MIFSQISIEKGNFYVKKTKTAALICEFNPLHTGHEYILRKIGEERNVICIMSGNFVQRGGMAIADKFTRAKAAVLSGADLVIELPFPYCMGSAEYFARGAVSVLDRLSLVDELWFGCECGDAERLYEIARNMLSEKYRSALADCSARQGYAASSQRIYNGLFGECPELEKPNNILAIEYIKALICAGSQIKPVAIKRDGDFNSETLEKGKFPSATAIRRAILERGELPAEYLPASAEALRDAEKKGLFPVTEKDGALLFSLRLADEKRLAEADGASGGLANRIYSAALQSGTAEEFFSKLSTKKYTDARLRRTVYNCLFGITESDMKRPPDHTQVLGLNSVGREMLSRIRKTARIPVITKPADVPAYSRQAQLTHIADSYFTLKLPAPRESGFFKKMSPFVCENKE